MKGNTQRAICDMEKAGGRTQLVCTMQGEKAMCTYVRVSGGYKL